MGIIFFLGKNPVIDLFSNHQVIGGWITVLASITLFAWEYIRLEPSGRWLAHALIVRRIAFTLAVISVIFIGSRFADIWTIANGM